MSVGTCCDPWAGQIKLDPLIRRTEKKKRSVHFFSRTVSKLRGKAKRPRKEQTEEIEPRGWLAWIPHCPEANLLSFSFEWGLDFWSGKISLFSLLKSPLSYLTFSLEGFGDSESSVKIEKWKSETISLFLFIDCPLTSRPNLLQFKSLKILPSPLLNFLKFVDWRILRPRYC